MVKTGLLGLALFIAILSGCAERQVNQPQSNAFMVVGAQVFDGERIHSQANVLVRDGRIITLDPSANMEDVKMDGVTLIDGKGQTLLPGFIDTHTHTESVTQLSDALLFGVTTVLDMGTFSEYDKALRDAAATRADIADFRSSGIFITAPGGHGTEYDGYEIPVLEKAEDAEAFVQERIRLGANYLKLVINGVRHQTKGMPTLDADRVNAIAKAGHDRGLLVLAHVENADDIHLAEAAGVDGLVHHWRDAGALPELAARIAAADMFVMPSLAVIDGLLGVGPQLLLDDPLIKPYLSDLSLRELSKVVTPPPGMSMQPILEGTRSLIDADVRLLMGSDAFTGNPRIVHGASFHRLLELFTVAGLSAEQVLRAATSDAADAFQMSDRGRIKAGLRADMVLVQGDPTQNIFATRDIARIWRGGIELVRD